MMLGTDVSSLSTTAATAAAQGLSIVVPLYNEAAGLALLHQRLCGLAKTLKDRYRLACEVVPTLRSSAVLEAAVAWRPIPADGLPSVGGIDEIAGYYEAVTHSGVTLAAVIGRCLAREIMDGDIEPVVAPFRPDRFDHDPSDDAPARRW